MVRKLCLTLALALMAAPAFAADYQASLGPMPLDDETKQVIAGARRRHRHIRRQDADGDGRLSWPAVQRHRGACFS